MVAFLASCTKDYDELIVGKWRIQSTEGLGQTISDGSSDQSSDQIEYVDYWGWVFNSDGTGYAYEISDGSENVTGQLSYIIDKDKLHMTTTTGGQIDWTIETLNKRKLRLADKLYVTDIEGNYVQYDYVYLNFKRM